MLTQSPNREILGRVHAYLEGEAETFRAWWVLLCHWLGQSPRSRPPPTAAEGGPAAEGGAADDARATTVGAGDGDEEAVQHELRSSMMSAMESRLSNDFASMGPAFQQRYDAIAE